MKVITIVRPMSQEFPKSTNSENKQFGFGPKLENPHSLVMSSVRVLAPNISLHTLCSRGVRAHVAHTHPAIVILQVDVVPRPERGGNTANFTKVWLPHTSISAAGSLAMGFPTRPPRVPQPRARPLSCLPKPLAAPSACEFIASPPQRVRIKRAHTRLCEFIIAGVPKTRGEGGRGCLSFWALFRVLELFWIVLKLLWHRIFSRFGPFFDFRNKKEFLWNRPNKYDCHTSYKIWDYEA